VLGEELARTGVEEQRKLLAALALVFIGIVMVATAKRLDLVYATSSPVAPPKRTPQHAASMSTGSRAGLSLAVVAAAMVAWARRK
jgi:hypothetical protein